MHVRTRSANLPKLNASRRFKHMERFVLPSGQNPPLTSHAVRCYKCCLGLPLAFCAAFRCSLRWRFTTRLFVHVFLPFGFFDKLQNTAQCIRVGRCFCCETVKPFHSFFFLEGCTPEHTALELNGHPVGPVPVSAAIPPLSHLIVLLRDSCHPPPRFGMGAAGR